MKFEQQKDGDWIRPIRRGYKIRCCKCGLIHRLNYKLKKEGKRNVIMFQAFREE